MNRVLLFLAAASLAFMTSCAPNDDGSGFHLTWLFWPLFAGTLTAIVLGSIWDKRESKRNRKYMEQCRRVLDRESERYDVSEEVTGTRNRFRMIVDESERRIIIIYSAFKVPAKIIDFADVRSVEIIEDGTTVMSRSMGRTVGGAIVGAILAGKAGAIVGGLSGDTKKKRFISSIDVLLKLRDLSEPTYTINCFNAQEMCKKKEVKVDDPLHKDILSDAYKDADRIAELVGVIIDSYEGLEDDVMPWSAYPESTASDIEALEKLASLKERGLITDSEYESMKAKIISK